MESGERNQVHSELSQVRVELTGESQAAGDTGDGSRHQVVQVTIGGGGQFQSSETDIVQSLVINAHDFVGVFDKLMHGQGGVVGLDDSVGHLGGWHDGEGAHDSVGVFFSDFGDQEGSHTGAGTTSEGVGDLESLKAVAALSFLSYDIQNGVNEFSTFGVVALGPVVSSTALSEDKVVGPEELSEGTGSDGVHGSRFKIHQYCSGDVSSSSSFIIVNVNSFELEVGVSVIGSGGIDTVFIGNDFPELGSDLVSALASLNVDDFSHGNC